MTCRNLFHEIMFHGEFDRMPVIHWNAWPATIEHWGREGMPAADSIPKSDSLRYRRIVSDRQRTNSEKPMHSALGERHHLPRHASLWPVPLSV
jgi:hypothetical protein